jgi:hypothetical protein
MDDGDKEEVVDLSVESCRAGMVLLLVEAFGSSL